MVHEGMQRVIHLDRAPIPALMEGESRSKVEVRSEYRACPNDWRTEGDAAMKILVGYDGSVESRRAVEWASRIAAGDADGSVTVIGVATALELSPRIRDAEDPAGDSSVRQTQLDEATALLREAGVTGQTVMRAGRPAEEILDMADEGGFDLIVIGHRGVSRAQRFLMGSVSERVVRHASRPVLVAR
ncbi:MAG: universal stress protein [Candidatus Dormiibacter spiritus]|nr:MAG: universal stress protein [Candidatus Dormibacteraeota bacterium]